jgi:hypothetical protein
VLTFFGFGGIVAISAIGAFLVIDRDQQGEVKPLPALIVLGCGLCIGVGYVVINMN